MSRPLHSAFLALALAAAVCGCASSLRTPAGEDISSRAYNGAIQRNEYDVYCQDGRCDQPPVFLGGKAPVYPAALQRQGITGSVTLTFVIASDGVPRDIHVVAATRQEFAEAAVLAVRSWRYRPAMLKGRAVEMTFGQSIPFEL